MTPQTACDLLPRSCADAMDLALRLWRAGNDAGSGFAPDADDIDEAAGSYDAVLLPRNTSDDVAVCLDGERIIAIGGDASGGQAWAVDITDALTAAEGLA